MNDEAFFQACDVVRTKYSALFSQKTSLFGFKEAVNGMQPTYRPFFETNMLMATSMRMNKIMRSKSLRFYLETYDESLKEGLKNAAPNTPDAENLSEELTFPRDLLSSNIFQIEFSAPKTSRDWQFQIHLGAELLAFSCLMDLCLMYAPKLYQNTSPLRLFPTMPSFGAVDIELANAFEEADPQHKTDAAIKKLETIGRHIFGASYRNTEDDTNTSHERRILKAYDMFSNTTTFHTVAFSPQFMRTTLQNNPFIFRTKAADSFSIFIYPFHWSGKKDLAQLFKKARSQFKKPAKHLFERRFLLLLKASQPTIDFHAKENICRLQIFFEKWPHVREKKTPTTLARVRKSVFEII